MSRSQFFGQTISHLLIRSMRNLSFGPHYIYYRHQDDDDVTCGVPILRLYEESGELGYKNIRTWQVFGDPWNDPEDEPPGAVVGIFVWDHRAVREDIDRFGSRYGLMTDVTFYLASHAQMMQWISLSSGITFTTPSFEHLASVEARRATTTRSLRVSLDVHWADTAHAWSTHEPGTEHVNAAWEQLRDSINAFTAQTPRIENLRDLQESWANDVRELGSAYTHRPRHVQQPRSTSSE